MRIKALLFVLPFVLACPSPDPVPPVPAPVDTVVAPPDLGTPPEHRPLPPRKTKPTVVEGIPERVRARMVDKERSTFRMIPDNKLFGPGDPVEFELCAKDSLGAPVPALPSKVVLRAHDRTLAGPVLAGEDGCVRMGYVVQAQDMIGDPDNGVPDNGSYILDAYAGGRKFIKLQLLYDIF